MQQNQAPPRDSDYIGWGGAQALVHLDDLRRNPRAGPAVQALDGDWSTLGRGQGSGATKAASRTVQTSWPGVRSLKA